MKKQPEIDLPPALLQEYNMEKLRQRVRPFDIFDEIDEIGEILARDWEVLTKTQTETLKLRVDILFRKLAKVMPDLKLMEHDVGESASKVNFVINLAGRDGHPNNEGKKL